MPIAANSYSATDILIVGGGLSGLALSDALLRAGRTVTLVEARGRFGGRIKSTRVSGARFDLGPAWFWPGQPRIAALIARYGLSTFAQYASGAQCYEDENGTVEQRRGFASMEGSLRIVGGLDRLTDALAGGLAPEICHLGVALESLEQTPHHLCARLSNGQRIAARHVVLALPPRLAAHRIAFSPTLPAAARNAMADTPTWMAGHAKAVAIYDRPFWRDAGLSGDAMSRRGPLVEIHDASPANARPFALFGFYGTPPSARRDLDMLRDQTRAQLARMFGPAAANPRELFIADWAREDHTSAPADLKPLLAHPTYGLPAALSGLWDGRLHFAGTEVAPQFGGYLEGALEAAEMVCERLTKEETVRHAS